jgi:hypothetical protein
VHLLGVYHIGGMVTDCCIEMAVLLLLELLCNLATGCLPRICLRGNLFTNTLPGIAFVRHNIYTFLWVMLQRCHYQTVAVPNDRMISERLIGKDLEGSSHGLIEVLS